jgi:hypothetical protein
MGGPLYLPVFALVRRGISGRNRHPHLHPRLFAGGDLYLVQRMKALGSGQIDPLGFNQNVSIKQEFDLTPAFGFTSTKASKKLGTSARAALPVTFLKKSKSKASQRKQTEKAYACPLTGCDGAILDIVSSHAFRSTPQHGQRGACTSDSCSSKVTNRCRDCGAKFNLANGAQSQTCHGNRLYRRSSVLLYCQAKGDFVSDKSEELFKVHHGTESQIEAHRVGRIGTPKCTCPDALDISEQPCTFTLGGDCNNKQCTASWKEAGAKKGVDFAKCGNGHYYKWCVECKKAITAKNWSKAKTHLSRCRLGQASITTHTHTPPRALMPSSPDISSCESLGHLESPGTIENMFRNPAASLPDTPDRHGEVITPAFLQKASLLLGTSAEPGVDLARLNNGDATSMDYAVSTAGGHNDTQLAITKHPFEGGKVVHGPRSGENAPLLEFVAWGNYKFERETVRVVFEERVPSGPCSVFYATDVIVEEHGLLSTGQRAAGEVFAAVAAGAAGSVGDSTDTTAGLDSTRVGLNVASSRLLVSPPAYTGSCGEEQKVPCAVYLESIDPATRVCAARYGPFGTYTFRKGGANGQEQEQEEQEEEEEEEKKKEEEEEKKKEQEREPLDNSEAANAKRARTSAFSRGRVSPSSRAAHQSHINQSHLALIEFVQSEIIDNGSESIPTPKRQKLQRLMQELQQEVAPRRSNEMGD